ncbi:NAD dependent epimerase/dehydratase, putative [Ricinus communis]|uniref:NAD dependent epimerase/dehydratase, putative n=1 Tax=Ricinus communis TaxID=3988 RepID=B9RZD4_RICCO|nr:NAD dependent epimerase/dehydratase, putative [Ricinus communis]|eukprot:XP_002519103.1 protein TIC 62, chloroplastic [Ricinus communis]
MERYSLQSSAITTIPTSLTKSGFLHKTFLHGQLIRFSSFSKYPHARKIRTFGIKAQASGVTKFSSGAIEAIPKETDIKDDNLAFVAGATGRVGSRTVRELLKLGFQVRAGVRSAQRAQTLVQSVKQMKLDGEGAQPIEKFEIIECDLDKPNEIGAALGNASIVICCIGAGEKEVFDFTGPYRIDYQATRNLIDAATVAKVKHFIMVSSLGTNKVGFPAAILNLFWGVLFWKRKAEEALIASGIPYTIVRPGGMERPTDAYKETHNITLSEEDTLFGGQVSNLQVAELMAVMAKNLDLSYCKVVEVIAETTAPLTTMDKLLTRIPSQRIKPKEPAAAEGPEPAPSTKVVPEASEPTSAIEKEPEQPKATVSRPLSPYTAYDDLKPPTSPIPIRPSGGNQSSSPVDAVAKPDTIDAQTSSSGLASAIPESKPATVEAKIAGPLSPYAAYPDLKPPTSPSPKPSGSKEIPSGASSTEKVESSATGDNDVATITANNDAENPPPEFSSGHSPFLVYDDLKPPTSPSPIAPVGSVPPSSTNEVPKAGNSAPPTAPVEKQQNAEPKPRPLSPYTMYEDMKPPTSPSPAGN